MLIRPHKGEQVLHLERVIQNKMQSAPGCGMGGFRGKGLVLRGMPIRPHKG